jgi:mRNA interferase MazF
MVKQYEIYWVDLNPTKGSEINKIRPCLVISPNEMNNVLNTIIIAPITSSNKNYPTRVQITLENKKAEIMLDQIRTIDKIILSKKITVLKKYNQKEVKNILSKILIE